MAPNTSRGAAAFTGIYLLAILLLVIFCLIAIWPAPDLVEVSWLEALIPRVQAPEVRFIVLALLSGALGSTIRVALRFAAAREEREGIDDAVWQYIFQPFLGAILAFLVYTAIRGGLLSVSTTPSDPTGASASALNPFGVSAISGFVGLSSPRALRRLEEIMRGVFGGRD